MLSHPGLRLRCISIELLGTIGLYQAGMALVCLGNQLVPEVPQLNKALLQDRLSLTIYLALSLASFMDVINARLVALDLLLQCLIQK